eukprot:scaffold273_cov242-Pinguiococcus_pyrenoidosus.AAC.37
MVLHGVRPQGGVQRFDGPDRGLEHLHSEARVSVVQARREAHVEGLQADVADSVGVAVEDVGRAGLCEAPEREPRLRADASVLRLGEAPQQHGDHLGMVSLLEHGSEINAERLNRAEGGVPYARMSEIRRQGAVHQGHLNGTNHERLQETGERFRTDLPQDRRHLRECHEGGLQVHPQRLGARRWTLVLEALQRQR